MNDFDDIERALRERAAANAPDHAAAAQSLRPRVLAAMRAVRHARRSSRRITVLSPWFFAAGTAAAVVLIANLIVSSVQAHSLRARSLADARKFAAELRGLVPELDEREATRQALILNVRGVTPLLGNTGIPAGGIGSRSGNNMGEIEP